MGISNYGILTDTLLLEYIEKQDTGAVTEVFDRYAGKLYALIQKITQDSAQSDAILVHVFEILWRKIKFYDPDSQNPFVWLITLAHSLAVDSMRRQRNPEIFPPYNDEYENTYIVPRLSPQIDPLDLQTAITIGGQIESSLGALTEAQQYVIFLAYYNALTESDIAHELKIPRKTVRSKIRVAMETLRLTLTQGGAGASPGINPVYNMSVPAQANASLLHSFALGCLDKDEYDNLMAYITGGGEFPWQDLGDFQSIASLLAAFIDMINPPAHLKAEILRGIQISTEDRQAPVLPEFNGAMVSGEFDSEWLRKKSFFERKAVRSEQIQRAEQSDAPRTVEKGRMHFDTQIRERSQRGDSERDRSQGRGDAFDQVPLTPAADEPFVNESQNNIDNVPFTDIHTEPQQQQQQVPQDDNSVESIEEVHVDSGYMNSPAYPPSQRQDQNPQNGLVLFSNAQLHEILSGYLSGAMNNKPKKSFGKIVLYGVLLIFVLVTVGGIAYYFYDQVRVLEGKQIALQTDLLTLQDASEKLTLNQELNRFLAQSDSLCSIPLIDAEDTDNRAKFTFDPALKTGFLSIMNERIFSEKGYQLWAEFGGTQIRLGQRRNKTLIKINDIPEAAMLPGTRYYITQGTDSAGTAGNDVVIFKSLENY